MKIIIGKERDMENDDIFYNLFNSYNRKFQLWCVAMETTQYRSVSVQTPKYVCYMKWRTGNEGRVSKQAWSTVGYR